MTTGDDKGKGPAPTPAPKSTKTTSIPSQPRQKKPSQGGRLASGNRPQKKESQHMKKQESYQISGVAMKSNIRNNDICDELALSREGMRFDQRKKDEEER